MRWRTAAALALSTLYLGGCGVVLGIDEPKHRAPAVCGDGIVVVGEACDDGNPAQGDGCDASCKVEPGFVCRGEPSACARCGDGVVDRGEACDDANATPGDGCDATCALEPGYACLGAPSVCARCGDGLVEGPEGCDDGNTKPGDGCDATCATEPGNVCVGAPSICTVCGDGKIASIEACDDGNAQPGDGCDATCKVEHGFTCAGAPSACEASCGDGVVASTEPCDDGNTKAGDGCDPSCKPEHGFGCAGEPSVCKVHCGDGVVGPGEACDDGNAVSFDGCSASCAREPGFTCDKLEPTTCASTCGDGMQVGAEGCDDGNVEPDDGCDPLCQPELGFTCAGQPSVCKATCGDGLVLEAAGEECDDGNTTSGDCCSAYCKVEPGCEVEPNATKQQATDLASGAPPIGFTGDGKIRGAISVVGDQDVFALDLSPAQSVVRIETFDASGTDCTPETDTKVTILSKLGIQMVSDDNSGIGVCSALELNLASGSYFVWVQQAGNTAVIPGYTLEVDVQPSAGVESELNDTIATADTFAGTDGFVTGSHQSATDVDYYKLTIPGPGARSLRAEILEGAAETCESKGIQSRLTLFDAASTLLADDDAGLGRGLCSLLDGTGNTPAQAGAATLVPGVYYLRVMAATGAVGPDALFDYRLAVTIR